MSAERDDCNLPCSEFEEWLRDDSHWDWDSAELHEGRGSARSTFRVRFEPGELGEVFHAAQAAGMKTGEFIRTAALAAARGEGEGDATAALVAVARRCRMKVTFEPMPGDAP